MTAFRADAVPEWNGDTAAARDLQLRLAAEVVLEDRLPSPLRTVAGLDAGFEDGGAITRAAVVLLDADTLLPLESHIARVPTRMPYIPGLLSFRELPALIEAMSKMSTTPDLVFLDGQGIAHPRRLGVAAHFGVASGLPAIGVAKTALTGEYDEPGPQRGDASPLRDRGEIIGMAVRSRPRCRPLIVSPGHRVSISTAVELTLRCVTRYRLPEPTRLADRLASRRDERPARRGR